MMFSIIATTMFSIAYAIPTIPNCVGNEMLPDPANCQNYFICDANQQTHHTRTCPDGQLFNSITLRCDWESSVSCSRSFESGDDRNAILCTQEEEDYLHANGLAVFPNPYDCTKFHKCQRNNGGTTRHKETHQCEEGTVFSRDYHYCVPQLEAHCCELLDFEDIKTFPNDFIDLSIYKNYKFTNTFVVNATTRDPAIVMGGDNVLYGNFGADSHITITNNGHPFYIESYMVKGMRFFPDWNLKLKTRFKDENHVFIKNENHDMLTTPIELEFEYSDEEKENIVKVKIVLKEQSVGIYDDFVLCRKQWDVLTPPNVCDTFCPQRCESTCEFEVEFCDECLESCFDHSCPCFQYGECEGYCDDNCGGYLKSCLERCDDGECVDWCNNEYEDCLPECDCKVLGNCKGYCDDKCEEDCEEDCVYTCQEDQDCIDICLPKCTDRCNGSCLCRYADDCEGRCNTACEPDILCTIECENLNECGGEPSCVDSCYNECGEYIDDNCKDRCTCHYEAENCIPECLDHCGCVDCPCYFICEDCGPEVNDCENEPQRGRRSVNEKHFLNRTRPSLEDLILYGK